MDNQENENKIFSTNGAPAKDNENETFDTQSGKSFKNLYMEFKRKYLDLLKKVNANKDEKELAPEEEEILMYENPNKYKEYLEKKISKKLQDQNKNQNQKSEIKNDNLNDNLNQVNQEINNNNEQSIQIIQSKIEEIKKIYPDLKVDVEDIKKIINNLDIKDLIFIKALKEGNIEKFLDNNIKEIIAKDYLKQLENKQQSMPPQMHNTNFNVEAPKEFDKLNKDFVMHLKEFFRLKPAEK